MISRYQLFAFAGLVVFGGMAAFSVDYYEQAKPAMDRGESYDLADYTASVKRRYLDSAAAVARDRERREALSEGIRAQYPQAAEGWTRRAWQAEDIARLDPPPELTEDEQRLVDAISKTFAGKLAAKEEAKAEEERAAETLVYESDASAIALRITRVQPPAGGNALTDAATTMAAGRLSSERPGFAVIQGVAYRVDRGDMSADAASHLRVYRAMIGEGIGIEVRAHASEAAVYDVISAIDYDSLNAMLEVKVAGVGSHIATPPLAEQKAEAERREAERVARIRAEGDRAEAMLGGLGGALRPQDGRASEKGDGESLAGRVTGFFGGDKAGAADTETAEAQVKQRGDGDSRFQLLGARRSGHCEVVNGVKRCTVTSD